MKKSLVLASAVLASLALEAVTNKVTTVSPELREARRRARIERVRQRTIAEGGLIQQPYKGTYLKIVNAQRLVPESAIKETGSSIYSGFQFPIAITDGDSKKPAKSEIDALTAVVVKVMEKDAFEPVLLIAPEDRWAEVNITKLATDDPSDELLGDRVMKEIWRATCYLLGAANANFQPSVMSDIRNLKDLDAIKNCAPSPEPFNKMNESARALGLHPIRTATYKTACEEGWAPHPTNDVQKAIWDKVHTLPTEPIRILPESQKKK